MKEGAALYPLDTHRQNAALADSSSAPLLFCQNVTQIFTRKKSFFSAPDTIHAVHNVSFSLHEKESLGIVGESGCGKSTLAKIVTGLTPPAAGQVSILGRDIYSPPKNIQNQVSQLALPTLVQMIFQDPYSSLNPRLRIFESVREPVAYFTPSLPRREQTEKVFAILEKVGIDKEQALKYPHEFSGGQRQRIAIARALITAPKLVVCDEPTSSLDTSVQAQILNLLMDMQDDVKVSYLFISHDLSVVRHMSDRVLVMYAGEIVEEGRAERVFSSPHHPYTQLLLSSMPGKEDILYKKTLLDPQLLFNSSIGNGCSFAPRCALRKDICLAQRPELSSIPNNSDHKVRCYFPFNTCNSKVSV